MAQSILLKRSSVAGNVPDSSDLSLGEIAINTADGAVYIKKGNNDIVAVHDNDILHIDTSNSRVGIGTTSPVYKLSVNSGTSDWPGYFKSTDNKAGIIIADDDTTAYFGAENSKAFMGLQAGIHANNLNIDGSGNVGIGDTTPSSKLHVVGSVLNNSIQDYGIVAFENTDLEGLSIGYDADGGYTYLYSREVGVSSRGLRLNGAIYIDSYDGNVGVGTGTNSLTNKLQVDGFAAIYDGLRLGSAGSGEGIFRHNPGTGNQGIGITTGSLNSSGIKLFVQHPTDGGGVGIGTDSPQNPLEINTTNKLGTTFTGGTDGEGIRVTQTNYVSGNHISLIESSYDDSSSTPDARIGVLYNSSGSTLKFGTSNNYTFGITNTAMVINPTGRVGIGTDAPDTTLHVDGVVKIGDTLTLKEDGTNDEIKSTANVLYVKADEYSFQDNSNNQRIAIGSSGAIEFNNAYTFPTSDGTSNQVLTTNGSGQLSFADVSGTSGISVTNNANNRVLTGDGTNANAEANLTFDGSTLDVTGAITSTGTITSGGQFTSASGDVTFRRAGSSTARILIESGNTTSGQNFTVNGDLTSSGRIKTTNGLFQADEDSQKFRQYHIETLDAGGSFLLGKIENSGSTDGGVEGVVRFAYDFGSTTNNCAIHFNFAQRSGTARGTWWYEHDDQDGAADRVHVRLIDDGAGNMYVWVTCVDYAETFIEANWRHGASIADSGTLSSGTLTTGTTLFDTADDPTSEMHIGKLFAHDNVYIPDSNYLLIGDGEDLQLQHNGSHSYIRSNTGDLYIRNNANDKDIFLQSDDGSGGVENYIQIDGSEGRTLFNKPIRVNDSVEIQVGNSNDLRIEHNGTTSTIRNYTGNWYFTQYADDQSIVFECDDGSGGIESYLTIDGANNRNRFHKNVLYGDGIRADFGNSSDLKIYHDGSNSYIDESGTGNLILKGGGSILLKSPANENMITATGNGAVTLYYDNSAKLATTSTGIDVTGITTTDGLTTSANITLDDARIKHNNTTFSTFDWDGPYQGDSGKLAWTVTGTSGAEMELSSDGSDYTNAVLTVGGQTVLTQTAGINLTGNLGFNDNVKALFGTNHDLQIYHDGTHSYISNTTGSLYARTGNTFQIENQNGSEDLATFAVNGAVVLYYDGVAKLATKSDGVDITGELQSDSLDVDGNADISGNLVLGGNLTVNGTTTTLNTATLDVEDKNITLNKGSGDTSGSADGAGITIQDAVNSTTDATLLWAASPDAWQFSHRLYAPNYVVTDTNAVIYRNSNDLELKTYAGYDINLMPAGNVGIGTTSPSYMLDVGGGDFFVNGTNRDWGGTGGLGTHIGTGDFDIYSGVPGSGSHLLAVTNAGNLGIGTETPSEKLEVSGKILATGGQIRAGSYLESFPSFSFANDTDTGMFSDTANQLEFATGGTSRLIINSSGDAYFAAKVFDADVKVPNQNLLDINSIKISIRNDIYGNATKTVIDEFKATYANDNTGSSTIRIYVDDGILVDGDTYTVSVYYEGLVGTLTMDWCDVALTGSHKSATGTTSSPASGRIYGYASKADYTSTFRFLDINLTQGANNTVTLFHPKVEEGTQVTDFVGTERTNQEGNSKDLNNLNVTGKVGIGTTSPTYALDVNPGASTSTAARVKGIGHASLILDRASTSYDSNLTFSTGGTIKWRLWNDGSDDTLQIRDEAQSGAIHTTFETGGNMGVGETNPSHRVEAQGTDAAVIAHYSGQSRGGVAALSGQRVAFLSTSTNDDLVFGKASNPVASSGFTEYMRIDNGTGRVGIGTTSPTDLLTISGNAKYIAHHNGSNYAFQLGADSSGDGNFVLYDSSGNVKVKLYAEANASNYIHNGGNFGVGTNTPSAKFHVTSSSTIGFSNLANAHILAGTTTGGIGIDTNEIASKGDHIYFGTIDAKDIVFRTAGANERMKIASNGNVSIGAPSDVNGKLHVNGNFRVGPYYSANDRDGFLMIPHGTDTRLQSNNERFHIENNQGNILITASGVVQIGTYAVDTTSTSSSATTQIAIHTFAATDFRSARFTVQVTNSTDSTYHTTELLLVHDGTTANITEFGEIHTGSAVEATFDCDVNSGNVRLLATPASTDTMAFKVVCHSITT